MTRGSFPVRPQRTLDELVELRGLTSDEHGAQRVAWTAAWIKARAWFKGKVDAIAAVPGFAGELERHDARRGTYG